MKKYSCFVALLLPFVMLPADGLRACSCVPPPPPAEEFQNSDAVFMGTVTSFKVVNSDPHRAANRKAKIRLLKLWKGDKALADEIFTGLGDADCGFNFEIGETYLIYAHMNDEGIFTTNICSRTAHVSRAGEDLSFLDQIEPLFTGEDSGCCGGSVSSGDAILAGLVFLFLFKRNDKLSH